ncbi:hypothetical protein OFY05_09580 [Pseudocitrobacter faecalis]|nr:hypothetical protein OFY05_09580 [Pseudocitrobacter faecalis]
MPFIPWRGYLFSYLTSGYRYALPAALCRVQPLRHSEQPLKQIVCTAGRWRVTAWPKKLSQTKIALHRTRLRFLDHKNFSVLFFFKPDRQTAPVLAALRKTRTEKIEKNFSVFHFYGSYEDLRFLLTI